MLNPDFVALIRPAIDALALFAESNPFGFMAGGALVLGVLVNLAPRFLKALF